MVNHASEEIIQNLDLIDVVSEYVQLKMQGKNYVGLCPFHQEKTPSFSVSPEKNLYYCFGCGAGGNVFNFIMAMENVPYREALQMLARRAGVSLGDEESIDVKGREKKEELFSLHVWAQKFFQYALLKSEVGEPARMYLKRRGYDLHFAQEMGLGLAPPGWRHLFNFLTKKGFSPDIIKEGGLILEKEGQGSYYDRFRNRLIFTIFNRQGHPIAFGGRLLDDAEKQPKYLNSSETPIFNKSWNLYGLHWAQGAMRKKNSVVLMEGYTDVLTALKNGFESCVASLGTSLTVQQAKTLSRLVSSVYVAYDADTAGQSATRRGMEILRQAGLEVLVVQMDEGDPDDFIREKGIEAFKEKLKGSRTFTTFLLDAVLENRNLETTTGRIEAGKECVKVLENIDSDIEREEYIKYVAPVLGLTIESLTRDVEKGRRRGTRDKDKTEKRWHTKDDKRKLKVSLPNLEDKLMACLFHEDTRQKILDHIAPEDLHNPLYSWVIEQLLQGQTMEDLSRGDDANVNEALARLQFLSVGDHGDELLQKFDQYRKVQAKEDVLAALEQRETMSLPWLNDTLVHYREIIAQERGLRKEGYCGPRKS